MDKFILKGTVWEYIAFEEIFLQLMDYQQYYDNTKDEKYNASFKDLIRRTYDYLLLHKTLICPNREEWIKSFYKDNKKGTHQVWLK